MTLALSVLGTLGVAHAQGNTSKDFVPPLVFQAAGPTADSIQGAVDAYRVALGDPNNRNDANSRFRTARGRREINWDGGWGKPDTTDSGHAVQRLPEHTRRPVHHTGDGPFAGSPAHPDGPRAAWHAL